MSPARDGIRDPFAEVTGPLSWCSDVRACVPLLVALTLLVASCVATPADDAQSTSPVVTSAVARQDSSGDTANAAQDGLDRYERRSQFLQTCLQDSGFAVQIIEQRGDLTVLQSETGGQDEAFRQAFVTCEAEAERLGLLLPRREPTEDELRELYRLYMWTHQCLIEHDFETTPPPSEEAWIESGGRLWHPYDALPYTHLFIAPGSEQPPGVLDEARRIEETCPDAPGLIRDLIAEDE